MDDNFENVDNSACARYLEARRKKFDDGQGKGDALSLEPWGCLPPITFCGSEDAFDLTPTLSTSQVPRRDYAFFIY